MCDTFFFFYFLSEFLGMETTDAKNLPPRFDSSETETMNHLADIILPFFFFKFLKVDGCNSQSGYTIVKVLDSKTLAYPQSTFIAPHCPSKLPNRSSGLY